MITTYYVKAIIDDENGNVTEEWIEMKNMPGIPLPVRTTQERDALPKVKGCTLTNDDTGKMNFCDGVTWKEMAET